MSELAEMTRKCVRLADSALRTGSHSTTATPEAVAQFAGALFGTISKDPVLLNKLREEK